jgi:nucleotide-binding universal stress UspA family protein
MSSVILTLLTNTEAAPTLLAAAGHFSVLLCDVRLEVMVVRIAPMSTIMPTEEILSKEAENRIRTAEHERADRIHHLFEKWASTLDTKIVPRWVDEEGDIFNLVKKWGERSDYIVAGRPEAHADHGIHAVVHAAIFSTDRPVLIVPANAKPEFGKTVAIAWRDDRFTMRAVLAALRCLPQATTIHVFMGYHDGQTVPTLPEALTEHDADVIAHPLIIGKEPFGPQLLAEAHAIKADMLVMGAFVHSAWHNMLFGGVTKHILSHADLPVMVRH